MSSIVSNVEALTLTLNGHIFTNFVAGDTVELEFPNDYSSHIISSNGGVNIQRRADYNVVNLKFNVQKRSDDDIFMTTLMNAENIEIINGSFKVNFDKDGVDGVDTYTLESGSLITRPTHTENDLEGNAASEYTVRFRSGRRNI